MKLSVATIVGAFVAAGLAKPIFTNSEYVVEEGVPITLNWSNASGPVTITLMTGSDPNNLKEVDVITCMSTRMLSAFLSSNTDLSAAAGETDGSFTYTPSDLPPGTYAFRIEDSTNVPNYSDSFPYTGTGSITSSAVSSSASVTQSSSSVASSASSSASESSSASSTSGVSSSSSSSSEVTSTATESSMSKFYTWLAHTES